ncbi:non-ribosomal peptide synthetase [Fluviispira multicolorata]|uniref:Amino acid adenylation domain-containing protein n=1 Tax=Fluviispira multicolorata TaxID=2654512 RepID=A0A833JAP8_9BACT|nr:non-ribosomal peptide synthetase [Fluviispira multicolorata]KAB8028094.1 amino acid adenylation domain-containing protein [Fluviispira multicolorata]
MKTLELSYYQKRFWLEWQLNPNSIAYNTPIIFDLKGSINIDAIIFSLESYVNYYAEGCRTFIREENGKIYQVILDKVDLDLDIEYIDDNNVHSRDKINKYIENITSHVFNLKKNPLYKFALLHVNKNHCILILNIHHIISDAITASTFINIFSNLYNSFLVNGKYIEHKKLPQFSEYVEFEKNTYTAEEINLDLDYWENLLKKSDLSLDIKTKSTESQESRSIFFRLEDEKYQRLKAIIKEEKTSIFIFLSALFGSLLLRYSGQSSVVLNYPVNMRPTGFRECTGCFVNNILFQISIDHNKSFRELLNELSIQRRQSKLHQRCTLTEIVERLREKNILKGQQFFNVDLFEAFLGSIPLDLIDVEVNSIKYEAKKIQNDIGMAYQTHPNMIEFKIEYNAAKFSESFIDNFKNSFLQFLNEVTLNLDYLIYGYSIISKSESKKILTEWNKYSKNEKINTSVISYIMNIAKKNSDRVALKIQDKIITYEELDKKSNQVANFINSLGLGSENFIGIYLSKSTDTIITILGVLKSGAAYVPLDPKYPKERIDYIIQDANLDYIIDEIKLQKIFNFSDNSINNVTNLNSAAYVIYTSGSTGKPKGVVVSHSSLLNHNLFVQNQYEITKNDRVLQFSSINFDLSIEEIFPTLMSGASLILYPDKIGISIPNFQNIISKNEISILNLPTAFWHSWVNHLDNFEGYNTLKLVIVGGEQANHSSFIKWNHFFKDKVKWINTYGPTEGTIISSIWKYSQNNFKSLNNEQIPIGRPIDGSQLYITDSYFNLVPIGQVGELLIAGENLARCYLNKPELTADKFIPNPFNAELNTRLYRTGDLARYLPDGQIEFIGRIDEQIKVRGFRVELGEIENVLFKHQDILNTIVLAQKNAHGENYLTAYIVCDKKKKIETNVIKEFIKNYLPDYMIPARYIFIDYIPLNQNGKVDKDELRKMEYNLFQKIEIFKPRNELENQIAQIWKETLGVEEISIEDNFFDLGAHSLMILSVHKKIEELLKTNLEVMILFQYPTVKSLSQFLSSQSGKSIIDESTINSAQKQRQAINKQRYNMNIRKSHVKS